MKSGLPKYGCNLWILADGKINIFISLEFVFIIIWLTFIKFLSFTIWYNVYAAYSLPTSEMSITAVDGVATVWGVGLGPVLPQSAPTHLQNDVICF